MTTTELRQAAKDIANIERRLNAIEDIIAFLVPADSRFRVGQRVRFSARADAKGIGARTKGGVRTGKVVEVGGFSIQVLLDGYKRPSGYMHTFFDPIGR